MIFFVLDSLDTAFVEHVVSPAYTVLSSYVKTPLRMGMILLVAVHGFNFMRGRMQELSPVDMGLLLIKMGLVLELLLNWSFFNTWVHGVIWGTYTGLGNALGAALASAGLSGGAGNKLTGTMAQLDVAFLIQLEVAVEETFGLPSKSLEGKYPIPGLGSMGGVFEIPIYVPNIISNIAGLIKVIMTVVLFTTVFIVMLMSRIGITTCLAVAPIFIALGLFNATRSYTDAWFRGLLAFVLTPMLLVLVLMMADAAILIFGSPVPYGSSLFSVIGPAIGYLMLYYALAKSVASVPQFATGLVGSLLSNMGAEAAGALVGKVNSLPTGLAKIAGGAAKGLATGGPKGAAVGAAKAGANVAQGLVR